AWAQIQDQESRVTDELLRICWSQWGGGADVEWAFRVARGGGWDRVPSSWEPGQQKAGDHKGPPNRPSSTLAPTEVDGLVLSLMHIGGPL
ncbi:MAG TPA: hypothetical protein VF026_16900, partial [Ktedonobacteraceae bacterium]